METAGHLLATSCQILVASAKFSVALATRKAQFRTLNADITFLQETHSTLQTMLQWKNEWGAKLITSHGNSNSRGVEIMMKNNLDCRIHHTILDPIGQYIILKVDIKE